MPALLLSIFQKLASICLSMTIASAVISADRVTVSPDAIRDNNLEIHYRNLQRPDEAIWLNANDQPFLSLYQQQRSLTPQGGAIIVHDSGQSADWPELLQELRQYLPDVGWSTLSVAAPTQPGSAVPARTQEPLPEPAQTNNDLTQDMLNRIGSALTFLNQQETTDIVFIGYGTGAAWITQFVTTQLTAEENTGYTLIIIDGKKPDNQPPINLEEQLAQLTIPVLDVWFDHRVGNDWQAKMRQAAMNRAGRTEYQQILETRPGNRFSRGTSRLTRRVWGWLKTFSEERDLADAENMGADGEGMNNNAQIGALRSEQTRQFR